MSDLHSDWVNGFDDQPTKQPFEEVFQDLNAGMPSVAGLQDRRTSGEFIKIDSDVIEFSSSVAFDGASTGKYAPNSPSTDEKIDRLRSDEKHEAQQDHYLTVGPHDEPTIIETIKEVKDPKVLAAAKKWAQEIEDTTKIPEALGKMFDFDSKDPLRGKIKVDDINKVLKGSRFELDFDARGNVLNLYHKGKLVDSYAAKRAPLTNRA